MKVFKNATRIVSMFLLLIMMLSLCIAPVVSAASGVSLVLKPTRDYMNVSEFQGKVAVAYDFFDYYLVNQEGKEIIKCDKIYEFINGLAVFHKDTKAGMVNTNGKIVIPAKYDYLDNEFHDNLLLAAKNKKYGFVNASNKIVISFKYDKAYAFSDGVAIVVSNNKYGVIDKKGKVIVPIKYEYVRWEAEEL